MSMRALSERRLPMSTTFLVIAGRAQLPYSRSPRGFARCEIAGPARALHRARVVSCLPSAQMHGYLEIVLRLAVLALLLILVLGIARVAIERLVERRRRRRLADTRDILALTPSDFEAYVAYLLEETGYRVKRTGGSGDRGIDLLARRDGETYVVQCKRYERTIGPGTVREMIGAMTNAGVHRGFLVTTSSFTAGAKQEARRAPYKLDLVDGTRLVRWAQAHGLPADVLGQPSRLGASVVGRQPQGAEKGPRSTIR